MKKLFSVLCLLGLVVMGFGSCDDSSSSGEKLSNSEAKLVYTAVTDAYNTALNLVPADTDGTWQDATPPTIKFTGNLAESDYTVEFFDFTPATSSTGKKVVLKSGNIVTKDTSTATEISSLITYTLSEVQVGEELYNDFYFENDDDSYKIDGNFYDVPTKK